MVICFPRKDTGPVKIVNLLRLRLSVRLALLVFAVEALLLGGFAVVVYYFCEEKFYQSLDSSLQANAEAIASLLEDEGEESLEFELEDKISQRFSRKKRPDLFAVILPGGEILNKSDSLVALPDWLDEKTYRVQHGDFLNERKPYRGISLPVTRKRSEPDKSITEDYCASVFYAVSTHDIEEQLEEIAEFLFGFFSAGLILSGLLAGLVVWRGLTPLRRLTRAMGTIGENSLDRRLPVHGLPPDLMPLTQAMNALLARLEGAFERERRFSADAAHELRTPISTLKSGIQAALLNPPSAIEDRRALDDLLEDVNRLEDLCDSLLLVASCRVDSEREGMDAEDWMGEVESALELLRPLAESRQSHLSLLTPESPLLNAIVRTDSASTRRIVTNLVDNAIRHGGSGTQISVRVASDGWEVRLTVEDNGPGVSPEDVPRLFERFFRADRARARTSGGTGLGLAICLSLAEAWGGGIRYEPVKPHGSRLVWRLALDRG